MPEAFMWIPLYALSVVPIGLGIAAYRGKWNRWAARPPRHFEFGKRSYLGFFVFYVGITIGVIDTWALTVWLSADPDSVEGFFTITTVLSTVLTASTLTIFPRFLQPAWYRRWVDNGAVTTDLIPAGDSDNPVYYDWVVRKVENLKHPVRKK